MEIHLSITLLQDLESFLCFRLLPECGNVFLAADVLTGPHLDNFLDALIVDWDLAMFGVFVVVCISEWVEFDLSVRKLIHQTTDIQKEMLHQINNINSVCWHLITRQSLFQIPSDNEIMLLLDANSLCSVILLDNNDSSGKHCLLHAVSDAGNKNNRR